MGCKLCSCTKPNEEDRLDDNRPKKGKGFAKRLKSRLFGRKKDATVDPSTAFVCEIANVSEGKYIVTITVI